MDIEHIVGNKAFTRNERMFQFSKTIFIKFNKVILLLHMLSHFHQIVSLDVNSSLHLEVRDTTVVKRIKKQV